MRVKIRACQCLSDSISHSCVTCRCVSGKMFLRGGPRRVGKLAFCEMTRTARILAFPSSMLDLASAGNVGGPQLSTSSEPWVD